MVEVIRNRGFRVPVLTDHDLDELFQLRTMLEVPAMREVAEALRGAGIPLGRARQRTTADRLGRSTFPPWG